MWITGYWFHEYMDNMDDDGAGEYEVYHIVNDNLQKSMFSGSLDACIGCMWGIIGPGLRTGYTHEELSKSYRIRRLPS